MSCTQEYTLLHDAPSAKSTVFMQRFRLFLGQCVFGTVCTYQEGIDGLGMRLVVFLLDCCLLQRMLNVEGRGVEPAPVTVLGGL